MNKEEVVQNLKNLLLIDSKSANVAGVDKAGSFVKELLKDVPLNWETKSKPGAAYFLIGRCSNFDKSKPVITLSVHLDTVLYADEIEVREKDGKIYGVGAQDVKAGVISIVEVLRLLHKNNKLQNIILALSPQEELAVPDYRAEIEHIAKESDYVMVFEPTLNSELDAPLTKRSIVTSRRGIQIYDLKIESDGGHSGVLYKKEQRKNSILLMAELIIKLESLADYTKMTTLNAGKIEGGKNFNIIAPNATLNFETRFLTNEEFHRVDNSIQTIIDEAKKDTQFKIELVRKIFFPAMTNSAKNSNFIEVCKKTAKAMNIELVTEERGGGSEASLYQYCNPEAAILDGFGIRGENEHTTKEFIYIDSILQTRDFSYNIINELLK